MLSFRQVSLALWAFVGFMVVGSTVMNLRYKPISESALLDTWTGRIHPVAVAEANPAPAVLRRDAAEAEVEIAILESVVRQSVGSTCNGVRFAFPAPQRVEVHTRHVRPHSDRSR